jgi:stringent starvation protein B
VVDATQPLVSVPAAHVHAGKITLNCSYDAVAGLSIENDWIQFSARFSGVSETISFPPTAVQAIYASENGQGVVFPQEESAPPPTAADEPDAPASVRTSDRAQEGRRKPSLKIVK